jgi:hypothetical protein
MNNGRKYWIRKDREQYFLNGVIAACVVAGFVTSYWHFSDRISVKRNLNLRKTRISKVQEFQKLREAGLFSSSLQGGATKYYKVETETDALPKIPDLVPENNGK